MENMPISFCIYCLNETNVYIHWQMAKLCMSTTFSIHFLVIGLEKSSKTSLKQY